MQYLRLSELDPNLPDFIETKWGKLFPEFNAMRFLSACGGANPKEGFTYNVNIDAIKVRLGDRFYRIKFSAYRDANLDGEFLPWRVHYSRPVEYSGNKLMSRVCEHERGDINEVNQPHLDALVEYIRLWVTKFVTDSIHTKMVLPLVLSDIKDAERQLDWYKTCCDSEKKKLRMLRRLEKKLKV